MKVILLILLILVLLLNLVESNGKLTNAILVDGDKSKKVQREKVFIVHGRNSIARQNVYNKLIQMGFDPIVLYEQANNGDTIIEKLEREVDKCKFGIVIVSPDNIAYSKSNDNSNSNNKTVYTEMAYPRLNVIFEFGLLIGKYGRDKVIYLNVPYNGNLSAYDLPSDLLGYVWVNYTDDLTELDNEINIGDYKTTTTTTSNKSKIIK